MSRIEILIPAMGEGIIEATLIKIVKKLGEKVNEDDVILEIATDKVDTEIAAPKGGFLSQILFKEGDVIKVGQVVAIIETEEISIAEFDRKSPNENKLKIIQHAANENSIIYPKEFIPEKYPTKTLNGKFLSPLIRTIAQKENIPMDELDSIRGTGLQGRITKDDVLEFLKKRNTKINIINESKPIPENSHQISSEYGLNVEIIEMDRMRKLIAEHMVSSKRISPHVTSFAEVDVTNIVLWREKNKDEFQRKENEKLTFTPFFVEAVCKAIKDFPIINSSVDETRIIRKKDLNIGLATALPNGNLIVPVIKNADRLNLAGLAKTVNDLANRARNNKLKPDEIKGGTFTITNLGTFGNIAGTPIINQPEVAILAVGAIRKKPAVIETPKGDAIAIRHLLILSLSYDHRVIDGALGGAFLQRVGEYLEKF